MIKRLSVEIIDEEVIKKAKIKCLECGTTLKEVVNDLLSVWVEC